MLSDDIVLSGHCYLTEEQEVKIQALVSKMRPEIPVLVAMMKKTNVKQYGNLVIRKDYALKYFPCEDTKIILQVPRRSKHWQCSLYIRPGGRCNLYMGKFVRENRVQEGDVCIFQPISKVNARGLTLMVHVLQKLSIGHSPGGRTATVSNHKRTSTKIASTSSVKEEPDTNGEEVSSSGYEDHGSSDNSEGTSEPPFMLADTTRLTQAQTKKVLEKVSTIESERRIYVAVMNKSNVRRHHSPYLSLGVRYVSRYLKQKYAAGHRENRSGITLVLQREGESRTWDMELRHWSDGTVISKGWPSFARTNNLREDDLCLFKVMENEEPLKMMVYIIRREKCLA
uniref:Uncharacterized protein n=3 Tax=Avena sativa TaxID=4498 RepID=A0ACD5XE29_AVESA